MKNQAQILIPLLKSKSLETLSNGVSKSELEKSTHEEIMPTRSELSEMMEEAEEKIKEKKTLLYEALSQGNKNLARLLKSEIIRLEEDCAHIYECDEY